MSSFKIYSLKDNVLMTQKNAILLAIENAKINKKTFDNETIMSILEATKSIAENDNLINSVIQLFKSLENEGFKHLKLLTKREVQILRLIGKGQLTTTIAKELNLKTSTVETHRKNIRKKLQLNGSHKLFEYALLYNLTSFTK